MTEDYHIKVLLASIKSLHASFQTLALTSSDDKAKRDFHEAMMITDEMIDELKNRASELETGIANGS